MRAATKLLAVKRRRQRVEKQLVRLRARAERAALLASMPRPSRHNWHSREAQLRAVALFWEKLTPEQRESFLTRKYFRVQGGETGRWYRISIVHVLLESIDGDGGQFFCLNVGNRRRDRDDRPPYEDVMLAKKILIENDEAKFLRTARLQGWHNLRTATQLMCNW